jgi:hypothetical protein
MFYPTILNICNSHIYQLLIKLDHRHLYNLCISFNALKFELNIIAISIRMTYLKLSNIARSQFSKSGYSMTYFDFIRAIK